MVPCLPGMPKLHSGSVWPVSILFNFDFHGYLASDFLPLPADFSKPDQKAKSSSHPRADPESSSCQREGLVAVLRTRPEVRENHGTMSAWDAKVAFGVRLASQYPTQL